MKVLTNTWRQLVRRRLWPVAVLLVGLIAAVPLVLAEEPAPVPAPQITAAAGTASVDDPLAEPVVARAQPGDRSRRRRVLGTRKDPFAPAPAPKKKPKAEKAETADDAAAARTQPAQDEPSSGGDSAPAAPVEPVPVEPVPVEPAPERKKAPPADSLVVRFGDATTDDRPKQLLRKLAPLPEGDEVETEPLLVYLGLTKNERKAIFLVDAGLETTGDGSCKPHPSTCETIELARGETQFFDVLDPETGEPTAQYQLDLVKINTRGKK